MPPTQGKDRRRFLRQAGGIGAGILLLGAGAWAQDKQKREAKEVLPPTEDLMREHGVLRRILLIYEEGARRLEADQALDLQVIGQSADIIRRFIEGYHEAQEEAELFPRFKQAGKLTELVAVLQAQHAAGRRHTEAIHQLASGPTLKDPEQRGQLIEHMRLFIRMYRPHAAHEDTVLFPALREIMPPDQFHALGETFEKREHEMFGGEGAAVFLEQVAGLEKQLGIHDLTTFTPG